MNIVRNIVMVVMYSSKHIYETYKFIHFLNESKAIIWRSLKNQFRSRTISQLKPIMCSLINLMNNLSSIMSCSNFEIIHNKISYLRSFVSGKLPTPRVLHICIFNISIKFVNIFYNACYINYF